jgi:hypothetical protein
MRISASSTLAGSLAATPSIALQKERQNRQRRLFLRRTFDRSGSCAADEMSLVDNSLQKTAKTASNAPRRGYRLRRLALANVCER